MKLIDRLIRFRDVWWGYRYFRRMGIDRRLAWESAKALARDE